MSEQENDRRALIPYAASYPIQVKAAGRQLSIASQLKGDIERGRLVAILKRISSRNAVKFLSACQALDGDLIECFANRWEWSNNFIVCGLSDNEALPWSLELLKRFEMRWHWNTLSKNEALPWSLELLERLEDRWDWHALSMNEGLPWSLELLERFEGRWSWNQLSMNEWLPWSLELFERFEGHWCWNTLSKNEALPWSLELLERFVVVKLFRTPQ